MFAISSILRVPRLNLRRGNFGKDDKNTEFHPTQKCQDGCTNEKETDCKERTNKKRKVDASDESQNPIRRETYKLPSTNQNPSETTTEDSFQPRPSKRLHKANPALLPDGDGDTWIEMEVVNIKDKKKKGELKSRSLFYSVNTKRAWWDEPPSGASNVVYISQRCEVLGSELMEIHGNTKQRNADNGAVESWCKKRRP